MPEGAEEAEAGQPSKKRPRRGTSSYEIGCIVQVNFDVTNPEEEVWNSEWAESVIIGKTWNNTYSNEISMLPDLSMLQRLEKLDVSQNVNLKTIKQLPASLRQLNIEFTAVPEWRGLLISHPDCNVSYTNDAFDK